MINSDCAPKSQLENLNLNKQTAQVSARLSRCLSAGVEASRAYVAVCIDVAHLLRATSKHATVAPAHNISRDINIDSSENAMNNVIM